MATSGWGGRILINAALLIGVVVGRAAAAPTTTVSAAFDGRQPMAPDRVFRNGASSMCPMKAFPGLTGEPTSWETFPFCNSGEETCFTVVYDPGTCGSDVHLLAYINRFDPNDQSMNYAGDLGGSGMFSFVVPAGAPFVIVAQTNEAMLECTYGFTIDAARCVAPAPALSRFAMLLALGVLSLVAAGALRRSRQGLTMLLLCAAITAFAAAPLAAESTRALRMRVGWMSELGI